MCTCQVWKQLPPSPSHRLPEGSTARVPRSTNCVCAATGSSFWHHPKGCALLITRVLCVGDSTSKSSVSILRRAVLQNLFLPTAVKAVPFPLWDQCDQYVCALTRGTLLHCLAGTVQLLSAFHISSVLLYSTEPALSPNEADYIL